MGGSCKLYHSLLHPNIPQSVPLRGLTGALVKSDFGFCVLWKLAARGVKVGMAAGNVAAAAVAVSSTSDSPLPQPSPSQPDPAAKAPALPASKPSTPAISMTAALKNVGAVSIHLVCRTLCHSIV